jgi:WD40 repeat protein
MVAPKRVTPVKEKKRKFNDFSENGSETRRRSARVAGMPVSSVPSVDIAAVVEKEDKRRERREGDFTMESATSESGHAAVFKTLRDITFINAPSAPSAPSTTTASPVASPAPKKAKKEDIPTPKRISPRRKPQTHEDEDKENRENNAKKTGTAKSSKKQVATATGNTPNYTQKKFEITSMDDMNKYKKLSCVAFTKSVPDRIYNISLHPSEERILIAAGDSWGRIGIWNYGTIDEELNENNTCVYKPHCAPVGGLQFSQADSSKLFSSSYDGTVRCADITTGMFTQIHKNDETRVCLDMDPNSSSILFVGSGNGILTMIDTRTPKVSEYEVHQKKIHSVSVHPVTPHTIATCSNDQKLCIWDLRKMNTPTHQFQHSAAVTSCAFSKRTGNYLASCSYDNHIRVWEDLKLKASINHNCTTGRWITPFKLVWDPKHDSVFACGNMTRSLDIFDASTHSPIVRLADEETLTAIPSINAFHQFHNVAVSATASGRTYVWKE